MADLYFNAKSPRVAAVPTVLSSGLMSSGSVTRKATITPVLAGRVAASVQSRTAPPPPPPPPAPQEYHDPMTSDPWATAMLPGISVVTGDSSSALAAQSRFAAPGAEAQEGVPGAALVGSRGPGAGYTEKNNGLPPIGRIVLGVAAVGFVGGAAWLVYRKVTARSKRGA